MKKLLYLLILISGIANSQIAIPDTNFMAKLLSASTSNTVAFNSLGNAIVIDTNGDGLIQSSEALQVTTLNIDNASINDLTGVNSFTNLTYLNCQQNQIASTNFSGLNSLQNLNCQNNLITTLNITGLSNLQSVNCDSNQLTSLNIVGLNSLVALSCINNHLVNLDASGLTSLQNLYCYNNSLQTLLLGGTTNLQYLECQNNVINGLNLSGLSNLQNLNCFSNLIASINLTGLNNLRFLNCSSNLLSTISLTGLSNLQYLDCSTNTILTLNTTGLSALQTLKCSNNQLTTLDANGLTNLTFLNCATNALTTLFIKNGQNETLTFSSNPDLEFICVDDNQIGNVQNLITSYGISNCVTNSFCTFTPGGNFNTITGTVLFDADNNGCNPTDVPQPLIRLNINDGATNGATVTNLTGNYTFYTQSGNFTITPDFENLNWFTTTPSSELINLPSNNNTTINQNFCIVANGVHPDVEVVIAPILPARPGFDAVYQIVYKNKGNQTLSGTLQFNYDDSKLDYVSSTLAPSSQLFGQLSWNYTDLLPFANKSIYVTLNVNSPTETPAVNINDVLNFSAQISPIASDEIASDNDFSYQQTVVGSFDPNNIICTEGVLLPTADIGNYLHYIINFENTGNFDAENIVLLDTIDPTKFDINSLQILNSSSEVFASIKNNIAKFEFKHIRQPRGGHGNILLKIRSKSDLIDGDFVNKNANIYFDYNQPISTNIANTVYHSLHIDENKIDSSIQIYPNPSNDYINIKANSAISSLQLYDVQGRLLQTKIINTNNTILDITDKSNGIYFLKVTSDRGIKLEKVVKK